MYLPAPGADFELPPEGTFLAVCYRILDMGTQETPYGSKHQIMLLFELVGTQTKDGKPFAVSEWFSWTMDKKAKLRIFLEAWRGTPFQESDFGPSGFNIRKCLGAGCKVIISHEPKKDNSGNFKAKILKIKPPGATVPKPVNEALYLWLSPDLWEPTTFYKLPEGIQKMIMKAPEFSKLNSGADDDVQENDVSAADDMNDAIPW